MTGEGAGGTDHRRADLFLLIATAAVHLVFEDLLHANGAFFAGAAIVWAGWLLYRFRQEPGLLGAWGLSTRHLRPALGMVAAVSLAGSLLLLGIGRLLGRPPLPAHFWGVVLLYLAWALVQQVALNGILARGLDTVFPTWSVPLTAAALFSLAHLPDLPLMGLTFAAGLLWVTLYLRWPNLWALTLCHGLLGTLTLTYYEVLGRDPWTALVVPLARRLALF